jgi:hypothetical protein
MDLPRNETERPRAIMFEDQSLHRVTPRTANNIPRLQREPTSCETTQSGVGKRGPPKQIDSSSRGHTDESASQPVRKKPRKRANYLKHTQRCSIIERVKRGEPQATLAREFGVTRAAVCQIYKNRSEILAREDTESDAESSPPKGMRPSQDGCTTVGNLALFTINS